ncbi:glycosyltransferase [Photobacterium leiognathi]|uniref:glycosyltransferase n=1 Tax=Photobacterium leiognathi TaxID=553611 RepID=UPI002733F272|nr:hypothetical protein [Photobacterium leiognathi]
MNKEVLEMGTIGFGANTENEWVDCLDSVINMSVIQRRSLGNNGRSVIMENFSQEIISNKLAEIYKKKAPL